MRSTWRSSRRPSRMSAISLPGQKSTPHSPARAGRLGQLQAAAHARKKRLAELFFQLPDLCRQGRLRHMQVRGGAGEVALFGDGPEIMQVVEVETRHGLECSEKCTKRA